MIKVPSLDITDPKDPDDAVSFFVQEHASNGDFVYVTTQEGDDSACVRISRADAHKLHCWLGAVLGMTHPAPSSPLTASRPNSNGTKAARNRRDRYAFDVVSSTDPDQ